MALVLGIQEGRSFYLNDLRVELTKIETPSRVKLMIHGPILQIVTIGPNNRTELGNNIFASLGTDSSIDQAKIALEAPHSIKILRDNLYDAKD